MRLLLFVSAFGILLSFAVFLVVLIKANKGGGAPRRNPPRDD